MRHVGGSAATRPHGTVPRVSLTRALLTSTATPAAVLRELADRGVPRDLRPLLLAHPALADDHPTFDAHQAADLRALAVDHIPAARRARLLKASGGRAALDFVAVAPTTTASDARVVADLCRTPDGRLRRTAAARLLVHQACPSDLLAQAVRVLAVRNPMRDAERHSLAAAVLRHPHLLASTLEHTNDVRLADHLARYAVTSHPGGPHAAWLADEQARLERAPEMDVITAVSSTADPDLATWALTTRPTHALLVEVLSNYRLPDHVKHTALSQAPTLKRLNGTLTSAATLALRTAPAGTLRAYLPAVTKAWQMPTVETARGVDAATLEEIWRIVDGLRRARKIIEQSEATVLASATGWALHPAATPALRASVSAAVLDYGCSPASDRTWRYYSAARALRSLEDVERHGRAGAGLRLPVDVLVGRPSDTYVPMAAAATYMPLAAAALDEHGTQLRDPSAARAFLALAPSFRGTLGELLTAATTVAA